VTAADQVRREAPCCIPGAAGRVATAIDALLADPRTAAAVQRFYDPRTQSAGDAFVSLVSNDRQIIGPPTFLLSPSSRST
jgi:hypothetical protein